MRALLLTAVLLLIAPGRSYAQAPCGTTAASAAHFRTEGSPLPQRLQLPTSGRGLRDGTVYELPVVVHVVWNEDSENITDAAIHQLIALLNTHYARQNDVSRVRPLFQASIAEMDLRFCLAKSTPTGGSTSGIVRHRTSIEHFDVLNNDSHVDAMKLAPTGSPAWAPERYLNIWICDLASATFPSGVGGFVIDPNLEGVVNTPVDGVVLDYRLGFPPYGRHSVTHEVGHYLGLMHPWGNIDPASCASSDEVDDTPPTNAATTHCNNTTRSTCPPDLVQYENFMDYASACAAMFTVGQKERARNFLTTYRAGLIGHGLCSSSGTLTLRAMPLLIRVGPSAATAEWTGHHAHIQLFDANGRMIYHSKVNGTQHSIPTTDLPAGVYTALLHGDQLPQRGRFVVVH